MSRYGGAIANRGMLSLEEAPLEKEVRRLGVKFSIDWVRAPLGHIYTTLLEIIGIKILEEFGMETLSAFLNKVEAESASIKCDDSILRKINRELLVHLIKENKLSDGDLKDIYLAILGGYDSRGVIDTIIKTAQRIREVVGQGGSFIIYC